MKKRTAKESEKIKKAKKKLLKNFAKIDSLVTREKLAGKIKEINFRICRNVLDRKVLKNKKSFSLFDENENSENFSKRVFRVWKKIEKNFF